jgi:hypothetical protein
MTISSGDHPGAQSSGGDPTPSRADIEMTRMIVEIAKPLGIAVHDHIIVCWDGQLEGAQVDIDGQVCFPGRADDMAQRKYFRS